MAEDEAFLEDMRLAARDVAQYLEGVTREQFVADRVLQDAVVRRIEIVGEASIHVGKAFRTAHPEIEWVRLANLRNFYAHGYRHVNTERVWQTAQGLILRTQHAVAALLPVEDGDSPGEDTPVGGMP